ncbi:MAG TPA: family 16 glycosylhydrolase [Saprospiraceae bacterium]|nr:family 16 glycosylhydrolase [Saprospiraceae bacterium]
MKKYYLLILSTLLFNNLFAGVEPLLEFNKWTKVHLEGGILFCEEFQNSFWDGFDGTSLQSHWLTYQPCYPPQTPPDNCDESRFAHYKDSNPGIWKNENVTVANGYLYMAARKEDSYWPLPDQNKREFSQSVVYMEDHSPFRQGKYTMRAKLPGGDKTWVAFWMWHGDEIDVLDTSSDPWIANGVHGKGFSQYGQKHLTYADFGFPPGFSLKDAFHEFSAEWDPFKVVFKIDETVTNIIYKYWKSATEPLWVGCGDALPEGDYFINPVFPTPEDRLFKPIIWHMIDNIDPATGIGTAHPNWSAEFFPNYLIVDYVKIEMKDYHVIKLDVPCDYCFISDNEVCLSLDDFVGNAGLTNTKENFNIQTVTSSNNVDAYISSDEKSVCLKLKTGHSKENIILHVTIYGNKGSNITFNQTIKPINSEPDLHIYKTDNGHTIPGCDKLKIYVDYANRCNDEVNLTISPDVSREDDNPNNINKDNLAFFIPQGCYDFTLTYPAHCGSSDLITKHYSTKKPTLSFHEVINSGVRKTQICAELNDICLKDITIDLDPNIPPDMTMSDYGDLNYCLQLPNGCYNATLKYLCGSEYISDNYCFSSPNITPELYFNSNLTNKVNSTNKITDNEFNLYFDQTIFKNVNVIFYNVFPSIYANWIHSTINNNIISIVGHPGIRSFQIKVLFGDCCDDIVIPKWYTFQNINAWKDNYKVLPNPTAGIINVTLDGGEISNASPEATPNPVNATLFRGDGTTIIETKNFINSAVNFDLSNRPGSNFYISVYDDKILENLIFPVIKIQ